MSTTDAALFDEAGIEPRDDVQRWLQQAFAAERAPARPVTAVSRPAAAPEACGWCRGFYVAMLGATLLTWLFA
jgi:hypothetical protein